jgi:hypothetical protein
MQLNRNGNGGTPIEAGTYAACLDHIHDLGLQAPPEGYKTKDEGPKYKRAFRFHVIKENGEIYRLSAIVTDCTGEKSRFREIVWALRGSDLTREEIQSDTIADVAIIGRSCLVTVRIKTVNGGDKTCIDSYAALPKGMKALPRMPESEIPKWVADMIAVRLDKPAVTVEQPVKSTPQPESVVVDADEPLFDP